MSNKSEQFFKMIAVIFIISIIYSLTVTYPNYGSSFDMGFSAGSAFGQSLKVLGSFGLIAYAHKTLKKHGVKTLD